MKVTQSTNAKSHELDRFVSEQNIVRYSRLHDAELDASRRRAIPGLLKREFDKLRELPLHANNKMSVLKTTTSE
jgi:hypothetical protein